MRSAVNTLLDLLYPPRCPACDANLDGRSALCGTCELSLYPLGAACPRCADPVAGTSPVVCRRCALQPPPFVATSAPFRYGGQLAIALQRLKYERRPDIARSLAPLLAPALAAAAADVDAIVPVPLHWLKHSQRGFNQAQLLVEEARWRDGPAIDARSLCRVRVTAPQTGTSARQRVANVAGAFAVRPRRRAEVHGKRVLLVDDVITTGATAAAAAGALLAGGAASVRCLCLARAET